MARTEPVKARNLDGYGAQLIEWDSVPARLGEGLTQVPGSGGPPRFRAQLWRCVRAGQDRAGPGRRGPRPRRGGRGPRVALWWSGSVRP